MKTCIVCKKEIKTGITLNCLCGHSICGECVMMEGFGKCMRLLDEKHKEETKCKPK